MLDQFVTCVQLDRWVHVHLDFTILVNNPLAEVPRQLLDESGCFSRLQLFGVGTEPLEDIVCVGPVDQALVHQWEAHVEL